MRNSYSEAVNIARDYYNSDDADNFYAIIWGGEDIHIGLYETANEPIVDASHRTVRHIAKNLSDIGSGHTVLDIGSGCGGGVPSGLAINREVVFAPLPTPTVGSQFCYVVPWLICAIEQQLAPLPIVLLGEAVPGAVGGLWLYDHSEVAVIQLVKQGTDIAITP